MKSKVNIDKIPKVELITPYKTLAIVPIYDPGTDRFRPVGIALTNELANRISLEEMSNAEYYALIQIFSDSAQLDIILKGENPWKDIPKGAIVERIYEQIPKVPPD